MEGKRCILMCLFFGVSISALENSLQLRELKQIRDRMDSFETRFVTETANLKNEIWIIYEHLISFEKNMNATMNRLVELEGSSKLGISDGSNERQNDIMAKVRQLENDMKTERSLTDRTNNALEKLTEIVEVNSENLERIDEGIRSLAGNLADSRMELKSMNDHSKKSLKETEIVKSSMLNISGICQLNERKLELVSGCCSNAEEIMSKKVANGLQALSVVLKEHTNEAAQSHSKTDAKLVWLPSLAHPAEAKSCMEFRNHGFSENGIYPLYSGKTKDVINVFCDMKTDNGGWTVFQRRQDGSVDFYRKWDEYRQGFGDLAGEFWLGNDYLHYLTIDAPQELKVELEDFEGNKRYALYSGFTVGSVDEEYKLDLGAYSGNAGDSLAYHNGLVFSTYDHGRSSGCARSYKAGWWYGSCHTSNLNGLYLKGNHSSFADGVEWKHWRGYHYSLKRTVIMFRHVS